MTDQTQANSFGSVSFLNIFGIFISVVLCILFIIMGGHTMKYIKAFAVKIKIIVNRTTDRNVQLKEYVYKPKAAEQSQTYDKMEGIFKNQIKKSRSLKFKNIFRNYMATYDHIVFFPFRNKIEDEYDLLRPKIQFYNMLILTSCIISWMVTIFLSAILSSTYSDIALIQAGVFVGITIAIAFISSLLNVIAINRLYALYLLNIKGAFKIDYGNEFLNVENRDQIEYQPENQEEEDLLFGNENSKKATHQIIPLTVGGPSDDNQDLDQDNYQMLTTTRKLLNSDLEKSDHHIKVEKADDGLTTTKKGKAIKDIFGLSVDIMGIDNAKDDDKYVFVEDQHAIGDHELLNNEGTKGENKSNIYTFMIMFLIISLAAVVCCYLNYQFDSLLAQYVFYMFIGSFFGDILIFRMLLVYIFSFLLFSKGKKLGYGDVEYMDYYHIKELHYTTTQLIQQQKLQKSKQTKDLMNKINDIEEKHYEGGCTEDGEDLIQKTKYDYPMVSRSNVTEFERGDQNYNTNIPLIDHRVKLEEDNAKYTNLMYQKVLFNPLADYNLLLLRKIYDAFDNRADKVLKQFRSDKHSIIRKRYMVPILNPNYDYDLLMKGMQNLVPDKVEDESVHLDGETVCNDFDKQLMEAIIQEGMDQLLEEVYERKNIDKFGKEIDENKIGEVKTANLPFFSYALNEVEENLVEDDEEGRWMKIMRDLKDRLAKGEVLTDYELALLEKLEKMRIAELNRLIGEIQKKQNLKDQDLLQINLYEQEKVQIWLDQLNRKKNKTAEDLQRIKELEYQLKLLKLEELRLKRKMGILTKEEEDLLNQLEREFEMAEIEELMKKYRNGTISEEEYQRLKDLLEKYGMQSLIEESFDRPSEKDENFADLPALEVINNLKNNEEEKVKQQIEDNQKLIDMKTLENQEIVEDANLKNQRMVQEAYDENQNLINKQESNNFGKVETQNEEHIKLLMEVQQQQLIQEQITLNEKQKQIEQKLNEEFLRAKTPEEKQKIQERRNSELKLIEEQRESGQKVLEEIEQNKQINQQIQNLEDKLKQDQNKIEEQEKKIKAQYEAELKKTKNPKQKKALEEKMKLQLQKLQDQKQKNQTEYEEMENLLSSQRKSSLLDEQEAQKRLEEQKLENERLIQQQKDENQRLIDEQNALNQRLLEQQFEENMKMINEQTLQNQRAIDEQARERQRLLEEQNLIEQQSIKDRKLLEEQLLEKQRLIDEQQVLENRLNEQQLKNQRILEEQERENALLLEEQRLRNLKLIEEQNLEKQRLLDEQNQIFRQTLSQMSDNSRIDHNESAYDAQSNGENPFDQQIQLLPAITHEDDELEAPLGPMNDESIYSHQTSTILDEAKVSFVHLEQMPNQDDESDESFSEQDMVYYNKDDLTNYSKGLGLNKVKVKSSTTTNQGKGRQNNQYFSENDLQEVSENEMSENNINQSMRSGRSYDPNRSRLTGRGRIQHNEIEIEDHSEFVDGRVKVDSWNLNYNGKKKKHRKKKITQAQKKRMSELQNIYGVDAETLAGLEKGRLPRKLIASGKFGKDIKGVPGQSEYNSLRSTQNTIGRNTQYKSNKKRKEIDSIPDNQSNLFSFNGYGTSQRWNDIKSTIQGGEGDNQLLTSKQDFLKSKFGEQSSKKQGIKGKMTSTQEKFGQIQERENSAGSMEYNARKINKNNFIDEESKSRSSRGQSIPRGLPKKRQKQQKNQKKRSNDSEELYSRNHSESDEAVDDKGASFQKNKSKKSINKKAKKNIMFNEEQEYQHSESDEGIVQENINFSENAKMFIQKSPNTKKRMVGSSLSIEDLEANNQQRNSQNEYSSTERKNGPKLATNKMYGTTNSGFQKQNRLQSQRRSEGDEDQFIVNSNHSKHANSNQRQEDEDYERYLLLQRERQIQEEIMNERESANGLAKKRKIRKAANSVQPHGRNSAERMQQIQHEKMLQKKREAENALFANEDDLEKGQAKMKKKKAKKETIKKEINYWLDYDSPYAEYLVARFREWSPSGNGVVKGPNSSHSGQRQSNHKLGEISVAYADGSRAGSKRNSRSPAGQRKALPPAKKQIQTQNVLQVNDFEEA